MSVRKLPTGRWQGRYRDDAGKQHTRVFPTRTAARTWAADGEASVRGGTHTNPRAGRITFNAWHRRWTDARVVEESTRRTDRTYGKDILERWGSWPLNAITRMDCQAWVRQLEQDGRGPAAVEKAAHLLATILQAACDEHPPLLMTNPARGLRLPGRPKKADRIIDEAEEVALLKALPTPQDRRMVEVLLGTGLRYGELAGLHAHRVDLERRELRVVEVLTPTRNAWFGRSSTTSSMEARSRASDGRGCGSSRTRRRRRTPHRRPRRAQRWGVVVVRGSEKVAEDPPSGGEGRQPGDGEEQRQILVADAGH